MITDKAFERIKNGQCPDCGSLTNQYNSYLCQECMLLRLKKDDPNHCGLEPFTTGPHDPYVEQCGQHDDAFIAERQAEYASEPWKAAGKLALGSTIVMLKGIWAIAQYPFMLGIGVLGGVLRWAQIDNAKKRRPDKASRWPE